MSDDSDEDFLALADLCERAVEPEPNHPVSSVYTTHGTTNNIISRGISAVSLYTEAELSKLLHIYYGFSEFRYGQYDVVSESLKNRDVAIFWSTGSGKSLCYILPALASKRITIVISPLISLMMDQCRNLNNTAGHMYKSDIACFLGSGQLDSRIETNAFQGAFLVVYLTAEKFCSCFPQLTMLHQTRCNKPLHHVCPLSRIYIYIYA